MIPADELKTKDITCSASSAGLVFLGDSEGGITIMSKDKPKMGEDVSGSAYKFSTYQTNENRPIRSTRNALACFQKSNSDRPLLLSVGEDGIDPRPVDVQEMAHRVSQLQRGNSAKELKTNTSSGVTKPYPAKIKFWKVDPKSLPVLKCSHEIVVFQPRFKKCLSRKLIF